MDKRGAKKAAINATGAGRSESFRAAGSVLVGIEIMHMIGKVQFEIGGAHAMSFEDRFALFVGVSIQLEGHDAAPRKLRNSIDKATDPAEVTFQARK